MPFYRPSTKAVHRNESRASKFNYRVLYCKLGQTNYRIRIDSENEEWIGDNEMACLSWPKKIYSNPKFLVTTKYLSAKLSPNNLDVFDPCL